MLLQPYQPMAAQLPILTDRTIMLLQTYQPMAAQLPVLTDRTMILLQPYQSMAAQLPILNAVTIMLLQSFQRIAAQLLKAVLPLAKMLVATLFEIKLLCFVQIRFVTVSHHCYETQPIFISHVPEISPLIQSVKQPFVLFKPHLSRNQWPAFNWNWYLLLLHIRKWIWQLRGPSH